MNSEYIKVAITKTDGSLYLLMWITNNHIDINREVSDEGIQRSIDRIFSNKDVKPLSWRIVPNDYHLEDRTYRNAWKDAGGDKVEVDIEKAKEVHKEYLRAARAVELQKLDIAYQKADEKGQDKSAIAAKKQELRDITIHPDLEAASTVEELKAFWPTEFGNFKDWAN